MLEKIVFALLGFNSLVYVIIFFIYSRNYYLLTGLKNKEFNLHDTEYFKT